MAITWQFDYRNVSKRDEAKAKAKRARSMLMPISHLICLLLDAQIITNWHAFTRTTTWHTQKLHHSYHEVKAKDKTDQKNILIFV